jgi:hypothetical protein
MNFLLKILLPALFDALIAALDVMAKNTSTTVDDDLVATVRANRDELIQEIYKQL